MDAAILSCQDCLFSQRVEEQLKEFLENLELNGQKIEIKLQLYDLKHIDHHAVAAELHRSKVQIVIISSHFIDRLRHEANVRKKMSPINRVLRPKRVIAVLVQLTADDVAEYHQSVLSRFHEWHVIEMKSVTKPQLEQEFCGKMSDQILKIYNAELSSTTNFVIFPNKVTKDQPKMAILFKKPIGPEENIRFELAKGSQLHVMNDIQTTNPCSALIRVPDVLCTDRSGLIEVTPFVSNLKMGTMLVKYEYHTKQIDEDVIERMSQVLPGFQKLLDDHISQALSKNFRLCEDFSLDPSLELLNDTLISREDDFPTVMHMACYYGLESTVWILLEEGDGLEQCSIRNDMNETPLDIANAKGYSESIGQTIQDYKEVNFTWKALKYVQELYERHSDEIDVKENGIEESQNEGDSEDSETCETIVPGGIHKEDGDANEKYQNIPDISELGNTDIEENGRNDDEHEDVQSGGDLQEKENDRTSQSENGDDVFTNPGHIEYNITSNLTVREKRLTLHQGQIQYGDLLHDYLMMGPPPPLLAKAQVQSPNYYDVVPTGREEKVVPVTPAADNLATNNVLTKKISNLTIDPNDYILVQPRANSTEDGSKPSYPPVVNNPAFGIPKPGATQNTNPSSDHKPPILLDASDENLIELMTNFKDNVYSMQQLQLLFENWKSRSDVQQDMKERQKELKRIRDEYKKMQDSAKKPKKLSASLKFFPSKKKASNAGLTHAHITHVDHHAKDVSVPAAATNSSSTPPSTGDSNISSPAPEPHVEKPAPVSVWKNPHDERFFTSYVQPNSPSTQPESPPVSDSTRDPFEGPEFPPPPRPAKKTSTSMAPAPMCLSPPAVPFPKKAPPPPPPLSPTPKLSFVNYNRYSKKK